MSNNKNQPQKPDQTPNNKNIRSEEQKAPNLKEEAKGRAAKDDYRSRY